MANLRNSLFDIPFFSKLQADEISDETQKQVILKHKKNECTKQYPVDKMLDQIQPFLTYCKFQDLNEARSRLFKLEEKKLVRTDTKMIDSQAAKAAASETSDYLLSTMSSYVGMHVNGPVAEQALKIIIAAGDLSKRNQEKQPVYVINSLYHLAKIYNTLPARSYWNPANFLKHVGLATNEPQVRAAIKGVFKAYDLMPNDEAQIDEKSLASEALRVKSIIIDEDVDTVLAIQKLKKS